MLIGSRIFYLNRQKCGNVSFHRLNYRRNSGYFARFPGSSSKGSARPVSFAVSRKAAAAEPRGSIRAMSFVRNGEPISSIDVKVEAARQAAVMTVVAKIVRKATLRIGRHGKSSSRRVRIQQAVRTWKVAVMDVPRARPGPARIQTRAKLAMRFTTTAIRPILNGVFRSPSA